MAEPGTEMTTTGTTDLADGRSARAARTRETVVDALLALLDEGDLRPTAREIAERAGVSLRSVYVHFDDLEDLFNAASRRHLERIAHLLTPVPTSRPLATRMAAFLDQRAELLEATAGVRRAASLQAPFSPTVAEVARLSRQVGREQIERVFAAELDRYRGKARERLLLALDVATGAGTWDTLRLHDGLSARESREVVATMLTRLLAEGEA
jgi:TetR/AcrR family transcriptional regulator, regulator of autoinduction and epiphytic fitness